MSDSENSFGFSHHYADVNNVRIHYVTKGEGKLILFVHGFPSFWYMWKEQLIEFGKDYKAVAMDMRGYNLSSKPEEFGQYRVKYLVEDIRALVDHLGYETFILVAHDWGGAVAWPFAGRHPDYLERLIIVNAPHPNIFAKLLATNREQQKASQYILDFQSPEVENILSQNDYAFLYDAIVTPEMKFSEQDRKMYHDAWSQPGALTGGLNYYRAAALSPPELTQDNTVKGSTKAMNGDIVVNVPTLVIWGEKDTALTVYNLEGLDNYVSNLTVKKIPDGSHWVVNEKPETVNSFIREFIHSGSSSI